MIVVIVEDVMVETYDKWSQVAKNHPNLKREEFTRHGDDWVCAMDYESHRISRDIKVLEDIATDRIFGKQKIDWLNVGASSIAVGFVMTILFGG